MNKFLFILILCCLVAAAVLLSCSQQTEPQTASKQIRRLAASYNPLGGRDNPLQTFIRTRWTDNDPVRTGGLHYDHIKIYAHHGNSFVPEYGDPVPNWETQVQFVVDHFDMYAWGGDVVGASAGDDFIWILPVLIMGSIKDGPRVQEWLDDPTNNVPGYVFDDFAMHYKYNTTNHLVAGGIEVPGFRPKDDDDGDGCIEPGEHDHIPPPGTCYCEGCAGFPCKSNRSAVCLSDARVPAKELGYSLAELDDLDDPYIYISSSLTAEEYDHHYTVNPNGGFGFFYDCVATNAIDACLADLDITFTYWEEAVCPENFRYIIEKYAAAPTIVANAENETGAGPFIYLANTVSPFYTCQKPVQNAASKEYLENMLNECWMRTNKNGSHENPPFRADKIGRNLECPYVDYLEQGKGYIFTCFDEGDEQGIYTGSDRGRGFSLATFYMINHQMAFYYYRTTGHKVDGTTPPVNVVLWNPMVEFNVGQPTTNSVSKPDFQGNMNTDRFFVWVDHQEYKILGREFLRDDDWRVLVLTKIIADPPPDPDKDGEGENPSCHTLPPRTWLRLMPDMTWSEPISQIVLTNNEGAILLKQKYGQEPPDPHQD